MRVRDIFLTPANVLDYQEENVRSIDGQKHLNYHMELNEALCDATSQGIDSGGEYASWLNNIGIQHQTEFGWWNETAVDKDNMQAFVDYWHGEQGDSLVDAYLELKNKIKDLPKNLRLEMIGNHTNVRDYLGV
ncbi:hypothetical protein [Thalassolituus sp.]|uniref:hypothetical protein n=1 Tax=Thalassolituus sp. TaxID=2030822 RepID=UPI002628476C|nr:hypothetical protein [Thalassolituus sp.]